jgi:hypothetical protein
MIRILWAAAAVTGAATFTSPPAQAAGAPWCAVINMGNDSVHWDCQYQTIEACVPNVIAGNRGFCNENPRYTGPTKPTRRARLKRHVSPG